MIEQRIDPVTPKGKLLPVHYLVVIIPVSIPVGTFVAFGLYSIPVPGTNGVGRGRTRHLSKPFDVKR
jgi:hypothetical protein